MTDLKDRPAAVQPAPSTPHRPRSIHAPAAGLPESIEPLVVQHQAVSAKFDEKQNLKRELEQKRIKARADDIRAEADALIDGKKLPEKDRQETKILAELAAVERDLIVLTRAGQTTEDRLRSACQAARGRWLADVEEQEAAAAAEYRQVLADLREKSAAIQRYRGARLWVEAITDLDLPRFVSTGRFNIEIKGAAPKPAGEVIQALAAAVEEKP